MPQGLVRSGDFRNGNPVTWLPTPAHFGTPVAGANEPFGNPEPQANPRMAGNPVDWIPSPIHFGNQVSFSLKPQPYIVIVPPGATGTTTLNLTNLFTGSVNSAELTYFGEPAGVTLAFAPNPDTATSVVTVTVGASVPAGKYTVTIVGTVVSPNIEYVQLHVVVAAGGSAPPPPTGVSLISHVDAVTASFEPNPIVTAPINTTGGNFLVAFVDSFEQPSSFPITVSDTINGIASGNTWVPLGSVASSHTGQLFYAANANVGTDHVFQASTTANFGLSIFVQAWSGLAASPLQSQQVIASPLSPNYNMTFTPANAGDLVIFAIAATNGMPYTVSAGFTISDSGNDSGGGFDGGAMSYLVAPSNASVTPLWTTPGAVGSLNGAVFTAA
jgi:hypothetical protein